ncbi:ubiquinol-cytochrome c reductase iron-sulfur subunit [Myxococcota bacterium]|nr:ubiquinol-cytochrome c reductase iron-sulfur subunit [Myxococcota bacterium]
MAGQVRDDAQQTKDWTWSRRDFLSLGGWAGTLGALGVLTAGFGRFMFPRVLFEPSTLFKAGKPTDYSPNTVSEKYIPDQRVWVLNQVDANGAQWVIALSAICTHLGCTPRWLAGDNKFKCPCHGSGFRGFDFARGRDITALNFEGPAPRPLERLKVWIDAAGDVNIDKGVKFLFEKGQWSDPASRAKV